MSVIKDYYFLIFRHIQLQSGKNRHLADLYTGQASTKWYSFSTHFILQQQQKQFFRNVYIQHTMNKALICSSLDKKKKQSSKWRFGFKF